MSSGISTVNWTNNYKQTLPVHFIPSSVNRANGLNAKNVEDAISYASGAYKYKKLPADSLVIMHKDKNEKNKDEVVAELHKPDVQINCRSEIKKDEKSSILNVVEEIGGSLPIYA